MRQSRALKVYIESVGLISLLCLSLFGLRMIVTGTGRYWFVPENLALAWAGLFFAWVLVNRLKTSPWRSWQNIALSVLWLIFLPNTWYVLTDFVHVFATGEISQLFDIVLIFNLVLCGFILGFTSLYLVHRELDKRCSLARSYLLIEIVILISSFAIYLGRILRWNSWDVLSDPGGLVINVSDRIIDPFGHPRSLNMTALFFVLLSVTYFAFYRGVSFIRASKTSH